MSPLFDSIWTLGALECLIALQLRFHRLAGRGVGKDSGGWLSFENGVGRARTSFSQIWVGIHCLCPGFCSTCSVFSR